MKPIFEKIVLPQDESFRVHHAEHAFFHTPWHFHPEYEILLIESGKGIRIVGDHIESYREGDLVFIGKNLPHVWKSDKEHYEKDTSLVSHALVIHFLDEFWEHSFGKLPENSGIERLFQKSMQGIKFTDHSKKQLIKIIHELETLHGTDRIISFVSLLKHMSDTDNQLNLASNTFTKNIDYTDHDRFSRVFDYILHHFQEEIRLEQVASMANLSKNAFCRYFKKRTSKTFSQFLSEIRIEYACRMLIRNEMTISAICYESGFRNQSNFNEQFKKIRGITPSEFKAQI